MSRHHSLATDSSSAFRLPPAPAPGAARTLPSPFLISPRPVSQADRTTSLVPHKFNSGGFERRQNTIVLAAAAGCSHRPGRVLSAAADCPRARPAPYGVGKSRTALLGAVLGLSGRCRRANESGEKEAVGGDMQDVSALHCAGWRSWWRLTRVNTTAPGRSAWSTRASSCGARERTERERGSHCRPLVVPLPIPPACASATVGRAEIRIGGDNRGPVSAGPAPAGAAGHVLSSG